MNNTSRQFGMFYKVMCDGPFLVFISNPTLVRNQVTDTGMNLNLISKCKNSDVAGPGGTNKHWVGTVESSLLEMPTQYGIRAHTPQPTLIKHSVTGTILSLPSWL